MKAASYGYGEIIRILIKAGANVDLVDHYGNTAYSYAKNSRNIGIAKMIREYETNKLKTNIVSMF